MAFGIPEELNRESLYKEPTEKNINKRNNETPVLVSKSPTLLSS